MKYIWGLLILGVLLLASIDYIDEFKMPLHMITCDSRRATPRFALCVQGPAAWLLRWLDVVGAMQYRDDINLFFLSFEGAIDWSAVNASKARSVLVSVVEPDTPTTWTAGRNALARGVYAAEVARGTSYSHWAFSDADMAGVICRGCPGYGESTLNITTSVSSAACCLDFIVDLSSHAKSEVNNYDFAVVYVKLNEAEVATLSLESDADIDRVFVLKDCGDANLNVIDREAATVLLPYIEDFDEGNVFAFGRVST